MDGASKKLFFASTILAAAVSAAGVGAMTSAAPPKRKLGLALAAHVRLSTQGGIGFDDLLYSSASQRVIAPAGNIGQLDLLEPSSRRVTSISGFSVSKRPYAGGHNEGVTSADGGGGFLFAVDRTTRSLVTVELALGRITSSVKLSAEPDYVRYVASTGEIWITEPDQEQIEVFDSHGLASRPPTPKTTIAVPGGPESLVIDVTRGRAYTHLWKGYTVVIDVKSHRVTHTWYNGCRGSRGIAIDTAQALVFVGCNEGRAVVLDAQQDGKIVSTAKTGSGVDIIAYNQELSRLYVPSAASATLVTFSLLQNHQLVELGRTAIPEGAHCVTTDNQRQVWVCDPKQGGLSVYKDEFAANP